MLVGLVLGALVSTMLTRATKGGGENGEENSFESDSAANESSNSSDIGEKKVVKRSERSKMVQGEGFDSPVDPLRVLRKAETVLQKRTKSLVVVIEKVSKRRKDVGNGCGQWVWG
jgi:hypothetical protein